MSLVGGEYCRILVTVRCLVTLLTRFLFFYKVYKLSEIREPKWTVSRGLCHPSGRLTLDLLYHSNPPHRRPCLPLERARWTT